MLKTRLLAATAAAALAAFPAAAQHQDHGGHAGHGETPAPAPAPAQDHSQHGAENPGGPDDTPVANRSRSVPGSGTSRLPRAQGEMHGAHLDLGGWTAMLHGTLWGVYTDQGGPRGGEKAFAASMAMASIARDLGGGGRVEFRAMASLDPLMGRRGYPNLFAAGETAHGRPLIDRQHPHDLFMELSARAELEVAPSVTAFVYGGPVGEPALGPSAFVHRASARYLPLSPIGHHWFDSTHITYGVVTAGLTAPRLQVEASAFRGREPDERRWDIETPRLDSWSLRATWSPSFEWAFQASYGALDEPEELHAGQDERRAVVSAHYARKGFAAMLGFSAKKRVPGPRLTAWIAEANWNLSDRHSVFGRVENVANDELFPDHNDPLHDRRFRITRFEGGYAWRVPLSESAELALGGALAAYAKPAALDAAYGRHPLSFTLFARLGLGD